MVGTGKQASKHSLAQARITGGRLQWRVDELRGERSAPIDLARDTKPGEVCALGIAFAVKHAGQYPPDVFPTARVGAQELADRLGGYQRALFRAAVVVEKLNADGLDLARVGGEGPAAMERDEAVLGRVTDAAYRLPYWTADDALLDLAPVIEGACELVSSVRKVAVQEAAELWRQR